MGQALAFAEDAWVNALRTDKRRNLPIASREQIGNIWTAFRSESLVMFVIDPAMLIALAALISSLSAFVWAVRRKP